MNLCERIILLVLGRNLRLWMCWRNSKKQTTTSCQLPKQH